jgi:hypothetical protein
MSPPCAPIITTGVNKVKLNYEEYGANLVSIKCLQDKNNDYSNKIKQNIVDISDNISTYKQSTDMLKGNNSKYHYDDVLDTTKILKKYNDDTLNTVLQKDLNELNLYQNSVYITSVIACATLAIALIIIVPSQKK